MEKLGSGIASKKVKKALLVAGALALGGCGVLVENYVKFQDNNQERMELDAARSLQQETTEKIGKTISPEKRTQLDVSLIKCFIEAESCLDGVNMRHPDADPALNLAGRFFDSINKQSKTAAVEIGGPLILFSESITQHGALPERNECKRQRNKCCWEVIKNIQSK